MNTQEPAQTIGKWARSRTGLVTIALVAIAGFVFIVMQNTRIFGLLPVALLLLCPLMMLFMHWGLGGKDGHQGHSKSKDLVSRHDEHSEHDEK